MTTPSTPFRKEHTLTGAIVPLPYDWQIEDESHLLVTLVNPNTTPATESTLVVGDDYAVSGIGSPNGGNVTPDTAYTAGWKIIITSVVPYEQDTDFTNQNSVKPEEVESMGDKLSRQIKQIVETLKLCVKTTVGGVAPDALLSLIISAAQTTTDNAAAAFNYLTQTQSARDAAQGYSLSAQAAAAVLPKNNYAATTNPTSGDDSADGYSSGSQWVNTVTGDRFLCTTATVGAAVWQDVSGLEPGDFGNMAFEEKANYVLQTEIPSIRSVPQNSKSAAYTLVLADAGKHIFHPDSDATARVFTIPANSAVAFPIGTAITFVNDAGAGAISIAITDDTMRLAGAGTTGTRTLAANGLATALKVKATQWVISGTGLT